METQTSDVVVQPDEVLVKARHRELVLGKLRHRGARVDGKLDLVLLGQGVGNVDLKKENAIIL